MPTNTPTTLPPTESETPVQNQIPPSETPQKSSKTMLYMIGGLIVLVLIAGVYMLTRKQHTTMQPQTPQQVIQQPTMQPKPTMPRSKALGVITNVVIASSLDALGNAVTPASTFASTQKTIYLVLTVNNPKVGTKFEYIRYLNNKFLDSGSLKIMKPNLTNSSFSWSLSKPGATHLVGNYKVKVYTNGVFEKETLYSVR